ncbi:MAG: hypothetical protein HQ553_00130 [Chloroflexi bacterium]|nr:hypothetical protein [Chloroflexota bacterium]
MKSYSCGKIVFIGAVLGLLLSSIVPLTACENDGAEVMIPSSDIDEKALAVTMWEFDWLVRRQGNENEYADWDKILDELAERGYNCIRIDAFPHLIASGPDGKVIDRFTILPQSSEFMWGNHSPVEVEPRIALITFLRKVREHGMTVGLSTWFCDDESHRADTVVTPEDYSRVWLETLQFLEEAELLGVIEWVDLCNEFPVGRWARGAYPEIFNGANPNDYSPLIEEWDDETRARIQRYFDKSIPPLRKAYPELSYTFSYAIAGAGHNLKDLDTSEFDLAELHIWLSDDPDFLASSGQLLVLMEVPGSLASHIEKGPQVYYSERDRWLAALSAHIEEWKTWADDRGLPVITTEAWGSVNYDDVEPFDDHSEWNWIKDVCAEGVKMASESDFAGICTSNFCQPHFEGMWEDVEWHRELTTIIRGAPIAGS